MSRRLLCDQLFLVWCHPDLDRCALAAGGFFYSNLWGTTFSRRWKLSRPRDRSTFSARPHPAWDWTAYLSRKLKADQKIRNLGDDRRITGNRIER
jgi:hypothetical protein